VVIVQSVQNGWFANCADSVFTILFGLFKADKRFNDMGMAIEKGIFFMDKVWTKFSSNRVY